jgi:hypothetical protein
MRKTIGQAQSSPCLLRISDFSVVSNGNKSAVAKSDGVDLCCVKSVLREQMPVNPVCGKCRFSVLPSGEKQSRAVGNTGNARIAKNTRGIILPAKAVRKRPFLPVRIPDYVVETPNKVTAAVDNTGFLAEVPFY